MAEKVQYSVSPGICPRICIDKVCFLPSNIFMYMSLEYECPPLFIINWTYYSFLTSNFTPLVAEVSNGDETTLKVLYLFSQMTLLGFAMENQLWTLYKIANKNHICQQWEQILH